jgi:hypothetical protein
MKVLKSMVRSNALHLSQVVRRVSEAENFVNLESNDKNSNRRRFRITDKNGDNCFLNDKNKVCIVVSVNVDDNICKVKYFNSCKRARYYPCKSSLLGIYVVSNLKKSEHTVCSSELGTKCVLLPGRSKFYCIPLCN